MNYFYINFNECYNFEQDCGVFEILQFDEKIIGLRSTSVLSASNIHILFIFSRIVKLAIRYSTNLDYYFE